MKTFAAVLRNNYLRTLPRLAPMLVMTAVALASILLGVYLTGVRQVRGHAALVCAPGVSDSVRGGASALAAREKRLDIRIVSRKPPLSALVEQRYDAYLTPDGKGGYTVETLRGGAYRQLLLLLLREPGADPGKDENERGAGVNILGFMMMFLLMSAFSSLFAFADDKEQGQLRRIAASPASFGWYLAAQGVYGLSLLLPEWLLLALLRGIGWKLGFTLAQFAGLMALLGLLGVAFALLLNTLMKKPDHANMLGNALTVLGCVFAGSFFSLSRKNAFADALVRLLPQKGILDFARALQDGHPLGGAGGLAYAAALTLGLFAVSCILLRRKYVKKI